MRGAIAAGHTVTAEAGARVLEAGGNAVDACLAAALASWVAESPLTGPGGGGFGLVYLARDASTRVYDFFAAIPSERRGAMDEVVVDFADASTQRFHVGEASCAVPGTVPGLEAIHRAHATIPWRELVAPAAALARAGVELTPAQAFLHEILDSTLRRTPEGRAVYPPPRAGDTLRLPALAATLDRFADEGSSAMPDLLDGLLPRRDLEAYRVSVRRPVETSFLGRRFLSNPPPSSGGVLIAYGLALLDRLRQTEIRTAGGDPQIVDLGSSNGTFVNGERLPPNQPRVLIAGDQVRIGATVLTVQRPGQATGGRGVHA